MVNAPHMMIDAEKCLKEVGYQNILRKCSSVQVGHCRCTVNSAVFIFSYFRTLNEAAFNLKRDTRGFLSKEGERFEGELYLAYRCGLQ